MRTDLVVILSIAATAAGYCVWIHELPWAAVLGVLAVAWWYVTRDSNA